MSKIASQEMRETALEAREQGVTFSKISQVLGKSMRTIQRWAKDYAAKVIVAEPHTPLTRVQ